MVFCGTLLIDAYIPIFRDSFPLIVFTSFVFNSSNKLGVKVTEITPKNFSETEQNVLTGAVLENGLHGHRLPLYLYILGFEK